MVEIEFRLPRPEYEAFRWTHNEHFSGAVATLEESLRALRPRMGEDGLPNSIYINGYGYNRTQPSADSEPPTDDSIVAGWRERHEPAIEDYCKNLAAFQPRDVEPGAWRAVIEQYDREFWDIFGPVHRDTVGQVLRASEAWIRIYTERFGEERRDEALAMLAGFPNASTARAAALWQASRAVAGPTELLDDIREGRMPAPVSGTARQFIMRMNDVLSRFGYTTTMHLLDLPTWAEDPAIPLGMVAAMAAEPDDRDPLAMEAVAAARRETLMRQLESLDDGTDQLITDMLAVYRVARHMAPASEDHNLMCDQRLIAAARAYWLRIGEWLTDRGQLQAADDVFHITVDEAVQSLDDGIPPDRELISARRTQVERWREISPPATLGQREATETSVTVLRGIGAAAGVYEGRARIIHTLGEAHRIQSGDVLVCPATTPEWTPYFGVIGALVADVGGLLTHAAVVAREFGIPAVVGAPDATHIIPDGAMVRVEGTTGTVTIIE
ncbi:MAG: hypothetical protein DWG82_02560 [Chloroflexi bacterium]|nr:hypothetical protein [Chloroflexota bacterium]